MAEAAARLFRLHGAQANDPGTEEWLGSREGPLGELARHWFRRIRARGRDVHELLHDGCATACVNSAALAYVNVFKAHVNVGFYRGALLPDPAGMLQGEGKRMRHVKLRPGEPVDAAALEALIDAAYRDIRTQVR